MALEHLRKEGLVQPGILREQIAAVSTGIVGGVSMLDLCYVEDFRAQVDLNMVATASGAIIEVQGTAEDEPMSRSQFDSLVDLGAKGIASLITIQGQAIKDAGIDIQRLIKG